MAKSQLSIVLPLRFLCTVAHLVAVIMVLYQRHDNVVKGLPTLYSNAEYDDADSNFLAAIWLSIICLSFELLTLFAGFSVFLPFWNGFEIVAHFVATLLCTWFLMEEWHYTNFWYIWVFTSLSTALLEVIAILRLFCCKVEKY